MFLVECKNAKKLATCNVVSFFKPVTFPGTRNFILSSDRYEINS